MNSHDLETVKAEQKESEKNLEWRGAGPKYSNSDGCLMWHKTFKADEKDIKVRSKIRTGIPYANLSCPRRSVVPKNSVDSAFIQWRVSG
jgi:hypothetical protein